jgi:hypothetical protein
MKKDQKTNTKRRRDGRRAGVHVETLKVDDASAAFRTAAVPERRALSRVQCPVHRLLLTCSLWRHLLLLSLNNSNMDAWRLCYRWLRKSRTLRGREHLLLLLLLLLLVVLLDDGRCDTGLRTLSLHRGGGGTRSGFVLIHNSVEMRLCCSVDVEGLCRHRLCLR